MMTVFDSVGEVVGQAVEALISCETGEISYVVVRSGGTAGIGEALRAVPKQDICFGCETLALRFAAGRFDKITPLASGAWPELAPKGATKGIGLEPAG